MSENNKPTKINNVLDAIILSIMLVTVIPYMMFTHGLVVNNRFDYNVGFTAVFISISIVIFCLIIKHANDGSINLNGKDKYFTLIYIIALICQLMCIGYILESYPEIERRISSYMFVLCW